MPYLFFSITHLHSQRPLSLVKSKQAPKGACLLFYNIICLYNKKPRLSRHSQEILRTCTHTGGCLPKYSWVSYMNVSIHAIFRGWLPIPKLVGSKISCLSYYAGKIVNLFFLHSYINICLKSFSTIYFCCFCCLK